MDVPLNIVKSLMHALVRSLMQNLVLVVMTMTLITDLCNNIIEIIRNNDTDEDDDDDDDVETSQW